MATFAYQILDPQTNKTLSGRLEAATLRDAKAKLRDDGVIPIKLTEEKASNKDVGDLMEKIRPYIGKALPFLSGKLGLGDLVMVTQQLQTLLDSGIPLIESLYVLENQSSKPRIRFLMKEVRAKIIAGESFSSALGRYPDDFTPMYRNLIKAGETSGELDLVCARLGALLEKYLKLQKKIQGAMVYPAFTILIVIGVVAVMMIVIVPKFKGLFGAKGADLPLPTAVLMVVSDITVQYWWLMLGVSVITIVWFLAFINGPGRALFDQWIITVPLFGELIKKVTVSRFIRTLATMVGSGLPLTEGVNTAASTVDNVVLRHAIDKSTEVLYKGGALSKPLEQTKLFPVMVVRMMAIGEESGDLEKMLNKSAEYLDQEVDNMVDVMTTLIEPIMIVVLGGIILWVALSLYMPMFDMGKLMSS
ncbi:MAG: type II secretion system F family protein [Vampirovibrionales bacterium]|nr:type II secretion system F family protein [Vampirovibrionales bacterium]